MREVSQLSADVEQTLSMIINTKRHQGDQPREVNRKERQHPTTGRRACPTAGRVKQEERTDLTQLQGDSKGQERAYPTARRVAAHSEFSAKKESVPRRLRSCFQTTHERSLGKVSRQNASVILTRSANRRPTQCSMKRPKVRDRSGTCVKNNTVLADSEITVAGQIDCETVVQVVEKNIGFDSSVDHLNSKNIRTTRFEGVAGRKDCEAFKSWSAMIRRHR